MKNIAITTLFTFVLLSSTFGQSNYEKIMQHTIDDMYAATSQEEMLNIANKFERIGNAESNWLPFYYNSYCYIMMTTMDKDVNHWDNYLNLAETTIAKAKDLEGDMVELLTLQGFASMMRITVDPATRGQEFSMKAAAFLQQAHQLDMQNPRALLMFAQMNYGTAQFFKASTDEACGMFASAIEHYKNEEENDKGIAPSWGLSQALLMQERCRQSSVNN